MDSIRQTSLEELRPIPTWIYPFDPLRIAGTTTGSADTFITVPANTTIEFRHLAATNTDTSPTTLSIHIIPSGGSIGSSNLFLDTLSIAADVTVRLDEFLSPGGGGGDLLQPGDVVAVFASTTDVVNLRGWGMASR